MTQRVSASAGKIDVGTPAPERFAGEVCAAIVHFLHVGKTGGTALKAALRPMIEQNRVVFHPHATRLSDLPPDVAACVTLRRPVARYVSAFNSRLRRGAPTNNAPWNDSERVAFSHFTTPNALAEALSSDDDEMKRRAQSAMAAIRHVNRPMTFWVPSIAEVLRRGRMIVLFQERLAEGFDLVKRTYDLPRELDLPSDPVVAHVTPPGFSTALSRVARKNLIAWYADDVALYERARKSFRRG